MPESTVGRVGLGLAAGGLLLGASYWWLDAAGQDPARAAVRAEPDVPAGPASPEVLETLRGAGSWLVYLSAARSALPPAAAPVVAVEAGGHLRLLRAAPAPSGPVAEPWVAAGIVLPSRSLAGLEPRERAGLLDALAALAGGGELVPEQVVPLGLERRPGEVATLLRWLR